MRVGAARSVYSLYDKPPSQQAIQFLIKKPIMRVPVSTPARLPHGWMLQREQTRGLQWEISKTRKFHQRHATSGDSGGGRDEGLGGP